MRGLVFSNRTFKEILRDPLSYIFCVGFPIVMLIVMTIVNDGIPIESGMTVFQLKNLTPGIMVFGYGFVMLFTCIQVSKDRTTALIMRLYTSPITTMDFLIGYTLPVALIAFLQSVVTYLAAGIISIIVGESLNIVNMIICLICLIPTAVLLIGFGLLFGTMFSEKASPGFCSIIISLLSMIGGVFMDVDMMGGAIKNVSHALPFYHGVHIARCAFSGDLSGLGKSFIIVSVWAVAVYLLACFVLKSKMQKDTQ